MASEPRLDHPDITADILCGLPLPGREIDLVLLYHDARDKSLQLNTPQGHPIHSFVLIVEVKQHSSDLIRFEGAKVLVEYDGESSDATQQCDDQTYVLKNYMTATHSRDKRRKLSFVQRAIWLANASHLAFDGTPAASSVPVHFKDLRWDRLVDRFVIAKKFKQIRALNDHPDHSEYHSLKTLREHLTHKVNPTRQDMRRMNALAKTRFDEEKTKYIQNLGNGLLILRGRGGTGKTFALVQIALHLARQGKRTVLLTYNNALIADIQRAMLFIGKNDPTLNPLPVLQTRYKFIQHTFIQTFSDAAEENVKKMVKKIDALEGRRLHDLMHHKGPIETGFDFVLVDEGQDWSERQRDFMFRLFGPGHVVVADGVDQFVGQDRCDWDRGDIPINRRHSLRTSRRTKGATCQTVGEIARELGLSDWDLEPDPNAHGGRFTVVVEPDAQRAVEHGLEILESDQRKNLSLKAVDNLVCLPSKKIAKGVDYAALFDKVIEAESRDSWRGFEPKDRRTYPVRDAQLRAVQYNSCRGMEGWTTLCLGLDVFFEFQRENPRIDEDGLEASEREKEGLLFSEKDFAAKLARQRRLFAINWLMIPLTRSVDHLVVHLANEQSELGQMLARVSARCPGTIEWIGPNTAGGLASAR